MGNPFTFTALMSIGHASYGKLGALRGTALLLPLTLCLVKTLVSPFIYYALGTIFHVGHKDVSSGIQALDFLFILGALPTGPACYVFATAYDASPSTIAGALVLGYAVAPVVLYLTSASILSTHGRGGSAELTAEIAQLPLQVGSVTVLAGVWMVLTRSFCPSRMAQHPFSWLTYLSLALVTLVVAQNCLHYTADQTKATIAYAFVSAAKWITHGYTTVLAFDLYSLAQHRSAPSGAGVALRHFSAAGLPVAYVVLLAFLKTDHHTSNTTFSEGYLWPYGKPQWTVEAIASALLILGQVSCVLAAERAEQDRPHDLTAMPPHSISADDGSASAPLVGSGSGSGFVSPQDKPRITRKLSWNTPLVDAAVTPSAQPLLLQQTSPGAATVPPRAINGISDKVRVEAAILYNVVIMILRLILLGYNFYLEDPAQDGVLLQLAFLEESCFYGFGLVLLVAFGVQDDIMAAVATWWAEVVCQGACCLCVQELGESFADSFRSSQSTATTMRGSRGSTAMGPGLPPLAPAGKRALRKDRPTSRSQPADLSRLTAAAVAEDRAEERALARDILEAQ